MRILIAGSSGLIGTALRNQLSAAGHDIVRLVRTPRQVEPGSFLWDPARGEIDPAALDGVEAAINLNGVSIGDKRWTDAQKALILSSRVDSTATLAAALAAAGTASVLLNASAVGIYGDRGDEILTEDSPPGDTFFSRVCVQWEAAAAAAVDAGIRTVYLRSGVVLGAEAPAVTKLATPFKFGLGAKFGSGKQWFSWIAMDDQLAAMRHLLFTSQLAGPVNVTSPFPRTNDEFTRVFADVIRRPRLFAVPKFVPGLILGNEAAGAILFDSVRAHPQRLLDDGFEFAYPNLEDALRAELVA